MAIDFGSLFSGAGTALSVGSSIYGAIEGSSIAKDEAQQSRNIAMDEMQADAQRRTAMELTARRQQLQTVRNQQMARSMALTTATSQGAAYGESSGLRGAYGSIAGQAATNQLGVSQNEQIGEHLFDINAKIDASKMYLAQDQSAMATLQGFTGMLGGIGKSAGSLYNLGTQFGSLFPNG